VNNISSDNVVALMLEGAARSAKLALANGQELLGDQRERTIFELDGWIETINKFDRADGLQRSHHDGIEVL